MASGWNPTFMGRPLFGPDPNTPTPGLQIPPNSGPRGVMTLGGTPTDVPIGQFPNQGFGRPPEISRTDKYGTPTGFNASGLNLDPQLEEFANRIFGFLEQDRSFNVEQREKAVHMLSGLGVDVQKAIPLNPYSDELRTAVLNKTQDQITKTGQTAFDEAAINRARRGFSAGGTTGQTAAGGIQADILGQRIGAETKTALDQLGFNQLSNQAREELLAQITGGQAQIQAGNVVDPETFANTLSNALGIQLSEQNKDEFMNFIKTLEPSLIDRILQTLPAVGAGLFPGGPVAQTVFNVPQMLLGSYR